MKSANVLKHDVKIGAATLVALGLLLMIPQIAAAQFGVAFTINTSEVTGTCSLNGGPQQTINPVDPASANTNGVNIDRMSTASGTACGVNFFTSGSTATKVEADDTTTTDDAEAEAEDSTATLNILNGLVTYDLGQTDHKCMATSSSSVSCSEQAAFKNIELGGSPLPTGLFTGPLSFNFFGLQLPGAGCDLLASYDGTLTLGELDPPAGQATNQTEFYALRLKATETCLVPLFTIQWDIQSNGGLVSIGETVPGNNIEPALINPYGTHP
jgi:hypothetical protein